MHRSPDFRRPRSATRPATTFPTRRRWWHPPASRSARRPAGSARLRWRYLASSPLTEDNAFRSPPTSIFNGRVGYRSDNGWRIQLDVLNLLNTKTNQITYAYGSLIKTDSLYNLCYPVQIAPTAVCQNGVMDYVLHPVEPLAVRVHGRRNLLVTSFAGLVRRREPGGAPREIRDRTQQTGITGLIRHHKVAAAASQPLGRADRSGKRPTPAGTVSGTGRRALLAHS